MKLLRVERVTADLARAAAFYRDALGFTQIAPGRLRLGRQEIALLTPDPPGHPYPVGSRSADRWFQHLAVVTSDIAAAHARLARLAATPISQGGPQTLPPETGAVQAWKFRDPDGHPLELLHFPPASGKWQEAADAALTLGYDHSAITVADTARSVAFYEALGLRRAKGSLNHGPTQQRLDAEPGAVVEVTPLLTDAAEGPHIELLAYRHPTDGRDAAIAAADIAADRLVLAVHDPEATLARGLAAGGRLGEAGLLRDPDGHHLRLVDAAGE